MDLNPVLSDKIKSSSNYARAFLEGILNENLTCGAYLTTK